MNSLILSLATLGGVAAALPAMTAASNAQPVALRVTPLPKAVHGAPSLQGRP